MTAQWFGEEAKTRSRVGAVDGLRLAAFFALTEANRTVPLDEGPLRRSGGTDVDPGALEAVVYYDTPYARRQHEELGWRHPKQGRAKWLELTMQEQQSKIQQIIATQIGRAIA